jgi:hypothetical protein
MLTSHTAQRTKSLLFFLSIGQYSLALPGWCILKGWPLTSSWGSARYSNHICFLQKNMPYLFLCIRIYHSICISPTWFLKYFSMLKTIEKELRAK